MALFDNSLVRRLVTITSVYVVFVAATLLAPLILLVALAVDLVRRIASQKPFMAVRMATFGWIYLLGEVWGLLEHSPGS